MSMSIRSALPAARARFPSPTLFPDGNAGIAYALVKWADAFFRSGLHMAIALTSPGWPDEFRRDRQQLFPDVDFDGIDLDHAKSQVRAHASFLESNSPTVVHFSSARLRVSSTFMPGRSLVHAREHARGKRTSRGPAAASGLGATRRSSRRGQASDGTPEEAFMAARNSTPEPGIIRGGDAQGLAAGMEVEVMPDDTRRGAVHGRVVAAGPTRSRSSVRIRAVDRWSFTFPGSDTGFERSDDLFRAQPRDFVVRVAAAVQNLVGVLRRLRSRHPRVVLAADRRPPSSTSLIACASSEWRAQPWSDTGTSSYTTGSISSIVARRRVDSAATTLASRASRWAITREISAWASGITAPWPGASEVTACAADAAATRGSRASSPRAE